VKSINYEADLRMFKLRKRLYGHVAPKEELIRVMHVRVCSDNIKIEQKKLYGNCDPV
jgi:hypothetical protein